MPEIGNVPMRSKDLQHFFRFLFNGADGSFGPFPGRFLKIDTTPGCGRIASFYPVRYRHHLPDTFCHLKAKKVY